MFMTTLITEMRPRFGAFIDVENDLIMIDRADECEYGFAYYAIKDADHFAERLVEHPGYFDCFPIGTFYPNEDTQYQAAVGSQKILLPARYTAVPVIIDGNTGFALRDHFSEQEAFFKGTNLADVAALLETNQASLNEKTAHAREQFFGGVSFLGVPLNTYTVTGPEFLVTPSNEEN